MVEQLAGGEATVGQLAAPFEMALPTISKHLKVLERARLIARRIEGRVHWIRLEREGLEPATDWLDFHRVFWSEGVSRIDAALATEQENDEGRSKG
jgi:DNA-binding transcriptional ArsR family regulator